METVRAPGDRGPTVHWVVPGLLAEGRAVAEALTRDAPDVVALTTSPAESEGLAAFLDAPTEDEGWTEDAYAVHLSRYGAVAHPPPAYLQAVSFAVDHGVPVHGLDLTEDAYDDTFTERVSTLQWWRYGRRMQKLEKRPPKADDAASFTLAWDARLRSAGRAIQGVEAHREATIADALAKLAKGRRVTLVADVVLRPGLERLGVGTGRPPQR